MPRKVSLPGTAELFRTTQPLADKAPDHATQPSGRVRHDEKITIYLSRDELLALEQARLTLRGNFDLAVDRGRLVREAIAVTLADLGEHGHDSDIVRRLSLCED
ncbi:MAG: hypothetical protein ACRCWS_00585 [Propionibacteriaceae bacterium]